MACAPMPFGGLSAGGQAAPVPYLPHMPAPWLHALPGAWAQLLNNERNIPLIHVGHFPWSVPASVGGSAGIMSFIGTNAYTQPWRCPVAMGRLKVR